MGLKATGIALVAFAATASAQSSREPLPIGTLLRARTLAPGVPAFSPDGALLAYGVVDNARRPSTGAASVGYFSGTPWWSLGADIWVSNVTSGETRHITSGTGDNWGPSWSPDGTRLAFFSDRQTRGDRGPRLWIWERHAERLHQVGDFHITAPFLQTRIEWVDNRTVVLEIPATGADVPSDNGAMGRRYERRGTATVAQGRGSTATVFHFDPAETDSSSYPGQYNIDAWLADLVLVDVQTGSVTPVVRGRRICDYELSPDRRLLAWAAVTGYARPGSQQMQADLGVYDLRSGVLRRLVTSAPLIWGWPVRVFSWSPLSDALAYRFNGPAVDDDIFIVGTNGGAPQRVAASPRGSLPPAADPPLWSRSGQYLIFERKGELWRAERSPTKVPNVHRLGTAAEGLLLRPVRQGAGQIWSIDGGRTAIVFTFDPRTKHAGLGRVNLDIGTYAQIVDEAKFYGGYAFVPAVSPDGRMLAFAVEDASHPADAWIVQAGMSLHPRQISHVSPELERFDKGTAKIIEWKSADGDTLEGGLIYPANYRPGERYPLIVVVYGGSHISDNVTRFGFGIAPVENLQLFASRGYAVLLADSRLREAPMRDLLTSVMPGVDRVIELGVADSGRVGIMGHSYGGYSTLALITQTHRFRAAVMRAGLGDLIAAYGQLSANGTSYGMAWIETGAEGRGMAGTPWEARERYIENSPVFFLDRVRTPLLIIHGMADQAVSPFLTGEIFSDLRRLGRRAEYVRYAGEDHWEGWWSIPNQCDYLARVIRWFDRYLTAQNDTVGGEHR